MQAMMQTPAARLNVSGGRRRPVPPQQVDIATQIRQQAAVGNGIVGSLERGSVRCRIANGTTPRGGAIPAELVYEGDQWTLEFAADDGVRHMRQQVVRIEQGVQAVETDEGMGIQPADALRGAHADPQCRVHRHSNPDEAGALDLDIVELVHREVEHGRPVRRPLQEGPGPGNPQGLVAQLVAGDQEYRVRLVQVDGPRGRRHVEGDRRSANRSVNATPSRATATHTSHR